MLIFPTDLLSQIFKVMSNYQTLFHVIDLKLDIEPSLVHVQCMYPASSAVGFQCSWLLQHDAWWSVVMNIYAQAAGGAYRRQ